MSDLVERLRDLRDEYAAGKWRQADHTQGMLSLAADEIERLQRLIKSTEKWRLQTAEYCERAREERDHYRNEYHKLHDKEAELAAAENERLRAALEEIAEYPYDRSADSLAVMNLTGMAREALRDERRS